MRADTDAARAIAQADVDAQYPAGAAGVVALMREVDEATADTRDPWRRALLDVLEAPAMTGWVLPDRVVYLDDPRGPIVFAVDDKWRADGVISLERGPADYCGERKLDALVTCVWLGEHPEAPHVGIPDEVLADSRYNGWGVTSIRRRTG